MAFVYSTDHDVKGRMFAKRRGKRPEEKIDFVSFGIAMGQKTGKMIIPSIVAGKAQIYSKCNVVLGYDREKNEIVIIQSASGNVECKPQGKSVTMAIMGYRFLLAVGFTRESFPYGRYEAFVKDGDIHVYLNKPLMDDEQSKKAVAEVFTYAQEGEE